jgi:hypothetical protein
MIVDVPILLFAIGLTLAYGNAGRRRLLGTALMVVAASWSLAFLAGPGTAIWGVGPALAGLMVGRPAERVRSSFEGLTRRALTLAGLAVLSLFLASRLTIGENPLWLSLVPWLLGAVGGAWLLSPQDEGERLQGQVLAIGASGALLLAAISAGPETAGIAGAMAIVPVLGSRGRLPGELRTVLRPLLLLLAAAIAVIAAVGWSVPRQTIVNLSFAFDGPLLAAIAIVLLVTALVAPFRMEWASLLAIVALAAASPALRWSAMAGLLSVATAIDRAAERAAWLGFAAMAGVPLVQAIGPAGLSARLQAVMLAAGLVLTLYAARNGALRVLTLPAMVMIGLTAVGSLSAANLTRFQWVAAAGALLLIAHATLLRLDRAGGTTLLIGDRLTLALMLVALSSRDAPGLGALALVLLVIAYAIVRLDPMSGDGLDRRLRLLARSNWPPSVMFAAATLSVTAALPASLALGLLAAGMVAALQLAPLIDGQLTAPAPERPGSTLPWLSALLSIATGLAPSLVLRMLRL